MLTSIPFTTIYFKCPTILRIWCSLHQLIVANHIVPCTQPCGKIIMSNLVSGYNSESCGYRCDMLNIDAVTVFYLSRDSTFTSTYKTPEKFAWQIWPIGTYKIVLDNRTVLSWMVDFKLVHSCVHEVDQCDDLQPATIVSQTSRSDQTDWGCDVPIHSGTH